MPWPPVCPPHSCPLAPHTLSMHKAALMVLAVVVATTSMDPSTQDGQAGRLAGWLHPLLCGTQTRQRLEQQHPALASVPGGSVRCP
ncbi:hypothetical protein BC831DRAFT_449254 [Entophlyctis helioformis]|nr:hypothetical protein BC831DRAFT_449254 [Entophlyctis helioformis]